MRRTASERLAARRKFGMLVGTIGVALLLASCTGQPEPATQQGEGMHRLYLVMWIIALVLFVGVEIAIWGFPIAFRRRRGDNELPAQSHGNNVLEFVWTAIPAVIVITLFALSWQQINKVQAKEPVPDREIKVIGKQWAWSFDYGNGVTVVGENATKNSAGFANEPVPPRLVVPVGQNIEFKLQSDDVIHSFYIPATLYKLDVVPGQQNAAPGHLHQDLRGPAGPRGVLRRRLPGGLCRALRHAARRCCSRSRWSHPSSSTPGFAESRPRPTAARAGQPLPRPPPPPRSDGGASDHRIEEERDTTWPRLRFAQRSPSVESRCASPTGRRSWTG